MWKRRFPCLAFGLRCKLETALIVIIACAVLHNFCIDRKDPDPETDPDIELAVLESTEVASNETTRITNQTSNVHRRGILKRESFVSQIAQNMF